jgi:aldehyde:ferredoxin oxidoreductase
MYKGYKNRYLLVDLSKKKYLYQTPPKDLFETFIGGKGAGLKLMVDMGLITHDPFSDENPLIFITGPFTGSLVQTSGRSTLVTKSPLTGTFLDSHAGGYFGPMVKKAGVDYIIITGKSDKPVYLHITSEGVKLEDASTLWGLGIFETEKKLKSKYREARIASIGPAGENKVKFACIGTELYRQFGRGGSGAVMGSKKLKAIVIEGNEKIDIHNREKFMELNSELTRDIMQHPDREKRFELGTNMWIRMGQENGKFLPTRNFKDVEFEDYVFKIGALERL